MKKLYKSYKLILRALAFLLVSGFWGLEVNAQSFDAVIPPTAPFVTGEADTLSYDASGFASGTTFILYLDMDGNGQLNTGELLASSTVQDDTTDLVFTWPDNGQDTDNLRLGAYTGSDIEGTRVDIEDFELIRIGADAGDNNYPIDFDRAGARSATSPSLDLDVPDDVFIHVNLTELSPLSDTTQLNVQQSVGGGAFTNLTDTTGEVDFYGFGTSTLVFQLPSASDDVRLRVVQAGSNSLGEDVMDWRLNDFYVIIGDPYVLVNLGYNASVSLTHPTVTITDVLDDDSNSIAGGTAYPGYQITIEAMVDNTNLTNYGFGAVLETGSDRVLLGGVDTKNNTTKEVSVAATIPANTPYDGYDVKLYAFPESDGALEGGGFLMEDFSSLDDDEGFSFAGADDPAGTLVFDQPGSRWITSPPISIQNVDGNNVSFDLARKNDVVSPDNTQIYVEYSTDGMAFTRLTLDEPLTLNSLPFGYFENFQISLPSGAISSNTSIRFIQDVSNGEDLDGWVVDKLTIESGTNVITEFNYGMSSLTINPPAITLDDLTLPDAGAFPMTALTFTYTIDEGVFPASTPARLFLNRTGDTETDILLAEISDVTTGSISFQVPALEAGDYDLYLDVNDQQYSSVALSIYDLGLEITDVTSTEGITINGVDYVRPGSPITVDYTLQGTPGSGAALNLSVFDDNLDENNNGPDNDDEFVLIGSTTTFDGSITATLPTGIDYDPARVRLSISDGSTYSNNVFDQVLFDEYFYSDEFPTDLIQSSMGTSDDFGVPDAFAGTDVRSATSVPFDFSYGGNLYLRLYTQSNFDGPFDVRLEGSIDGETWIEIETVTFTSISQTQTFDETIPNTLWSENFQFRLIYNEDGDFDYGRNVVKFYDAEVEGPMFTEAVLDDEGFNVIIPSLDVQDLESTDLAIGESVTINFNAQGFPSGTSFAAVVRQMDEYRVAGETSTAGATSINATMPIVLPFGDNDPMDPYEIEIVPFTPANASDTYSEGQTVTLNEPEDFEEVQGADFPMGSGDYSVLDFDNTGDRVATTAGIDLSGAMSATLSFDFNQYYGYGSFDINDNKNIVPRLQAKNASGTFVEIPVYELAEGEMQIYDDGLLYLAQGYSVDIPAAYLIADAQFRWVQPLNLGNNQNRWVIDDITLTINDGNDMEDNLYSTTDNPINIDLGAPDLNNYLWRQADLNDPVFNGETFDFSWNTIPDRDAKAFPAGTMFTFFLYDGSSPVTDPNTDLPLIIGTSSALGEFEGSVPLFLENDSYNVRLAATVDVNGQTHYIYGDEDGEGSNQGVGNLDVFLRALETMFAGDPNAVIYAGSNVDFSINLENDETNDASVNDLFANLILKYDGDDWLLAAQQGIGNISADLPPFVTGSPGFRVELSENAPLGTVGEIIDNDPLQNLEDDADNFISGNVDVLDDVQFPNGSGRSFITTRDFEVGELTGATLFSFDVYFDQLPEDLTSDQHVIFEYSTDGGATFTQLASFPDPAAEETLNGETFRYTVTDPMKENATRLRWRQEERKGSFSLEDLSFLFEEPLPFDVISTDVDISEQALLITSLGGEQACNGDSVTINYEIRGRFGADNIVRVQYENGSSGTIDGHEFNLTEGTGSIIVQLPNDVLDPGDDNDWFKFSLAADDDTYDGNNFNVNGPLSEQNLEYVAPIDPDEGFSVADPLACESEETIVTVNSPQNYFMYQVRNAANGTVLGSLIYNPDVGDTEINIGVLTETTDLELVVTAMNSLNASCNSLVSTYTETVEVLANYDLYLRNDNILYGTYLPVSTGDTVTFCEGSGDIFLRAIRILDNGSQSAASPGDIEWFKDNVDTPIDGGQTLQSSTSGEIPGSGWYFARIRQESCNYLTTSIYVDIIPQADQPTITLVSGDLGACEGSADVVLQAPAGYNYYSWSNGETTRSISVGQSGSYTVQVSNEPFDVPGFCGSPSSPAVVVNRYNLPELALTFNDNINTGIIGEGDSFTECESMTVYFHEDQGSSNNSGTMQIFRDGSLYASTNSDRYELTESGTYNATWTNEDLNISCTATSVSFDLTIIEQPVEVPVLTSTGATEFCQGEGSVMLTASTGFAQYRWYRNGSLITSNQDGFNSGSNTFEANQSGNYTVQVGTAADCFSPMSNAIVVTTRSLPSVPDDFRVSQVGATCGVGPVTFQIQSGYANNLYSYQLIEAATGMPSGSPVTGNDNEATFLTSGDITERTEFYLQVSYADGSGCVNLDPFESFWGGNNNVVLEMVGNTITANISEFNDRIETRWYRNGVELVNRRNSSSIMVADAATYSIEVDFNGGCTITSNSVSVGASTISGFTGDFRFSAHPNPAVNTTTVRMNGQTGNFNFSITNSEGRIVSSGAITVGDSADNESFLIDVSSLRTGIYVIRVTGEHGTHSERIVKQ